MYDYVCKYIVYTSVSKYARTYVRTSADMYVHTYVRTYDKETMYLYVHPQNHNMPKSTHVRTYMFAQKITLRTYVRTNTVKTYALTYMYAITMSNGEERNSICTYAHMYMYVHRSTITYISTVKLC